MTYQQALDTIMSAIDSETEYNFVEVENDVLCLAVIGLDKQIGKPPKWGNIYKCARCGKILGANHSCVEFCYHCGQKVDWEGCDTDGD